MNQFIDIDTGYINTRDILRVTEKQATNGAEYVVLELRGGDKATCSAERWRAACYHETIPNMDPRAVVLAQQGGKVWRRSPVIAWRRTGFYEWVPQIANGFEMQDGVSTLAVVIGDSVVEFDGDAYGNSHDSEQQWLQAVAKGENVA